MRVFDFFIDYLWWFLAAGVAIYVWLVLFTPERLKRLANKETRQDAHGYYLRRSGYYSEFERRKRRK